MYTPIILHIDLGNQSLTSWLKENKYIIHSELVRYCQILLENDLEYVQAIMVSNLSDNVVFFINTTSN
jgi:phage antirepressor YoqD-like protein